MYLNLVLCYVAMRVPIFGLMIHGSQTYLVLSTNGLGMIYDISPLAATPG
jgi:hypothetical protein